MFDEHQSHKHDFDGHAVLIVVLQCCGFDDVVANGVDVVDGAIWVSVVVDATNYNFLLASTTTVTEHKL